MLWGDNWHGKLVHFHSDNEAVVSVLNKGHAQDVALIHLMRCLAFLAAFHGFHFSSVHVPGRLNEAADALSRPYFTLSFHRHIRSQSSLVSSSAAGIGSSGLGLSNLDKAVQFLFEQGVASSTLSSYITCWRCYCNFCRRYQLQLLPLMETTLFRFVAFLANRSLSPQTVSVYLSACRFFQIASGCLIYSYHLCPS